MGAQAHSGQKRVLCMNKIDLVEKKKDLLQVANQFKDLPGYDRLVLSVTVTQEYMKVSSKQGKKRKWGKKLKRLSGVVRGCFG